MMKPLKLLSLFSGIGAFEKAFQRLGIPFELVNFCEIDKCPAEAYCAVHDVPMSLNLWDVSKVTANNLRCRDIDIITHGSPCQDFSVAGDGKGGDKQSGTRSSLMWETVRIVEEVWPRFVIWEQVPAVLHKGHRHNFDAYIEKMASLGYVNYYEKMNAKDYGVPQNRERVFTISIRFDNDRGAFDFPNPIHSDVRLRDILQQEVPDNYYLSEAQLAKFEFAPNKALQEKIAGHIQVEGYVGKPRDRSRVHNADGVHTTLVANVFKEPPRIMLEKVGYINNNAQANRVYSDDGASVALSALGGGLGAKTGLYMDDVDIHATLSVNKSSTRQNGRRFKENDEPSFTVTATDRHGVMIRPKEDNFCIRKLTPLECWRLMDFSDEDYYSAAVCGFSDSRLYKMVGNSIVVRCLYYIFIGLFPDYIGHAKK